MQIKVNKLKNTVNGDVCGASAVVIFLDKGNIVHEERFTGKTDSVHTRQVKWSGKYDKHEAVILDVGAVFEYELDLEEDRDQEADSLGLYKNVRVESLEFPRDDKPKGVRNLQTKKNADK